MKVTESSPGGKKLKQARLSFGAPPPAAVAPRPAPSSPPASPCPSPPASPSPAKRPRLQSAEPSGADDDQPPSDKVLNPFVMLVDIALKRKLKRKRNATVAIKTKSKTAKKNKNHPDESNDTSETTIKAKPKKIRKTADSKMTDVEAVIEDSGTKTENSIDAIVIEDSQDATFPEAAMEIELKRDSDFEILLSSSESADEDKNNSSDDKQEESDEEDQAKDTNPDMVTPKRKKSDRISKETASPVTTGKSNTPRSARKLTPKQIQKKLESAQRQEQRAKEKRNRDLAKQIEKEEKAKLKQERDELRQKDREEREKIKEEEKKCRELKLKAKELDEINKRKRKEAKEEERKKREEALEEMKRQKEIEKEELENRKKKTSMAFVSFFVAKEKAPKPKDTADKSMDDSKHNYLSNFTIKSDMRLAPIVRHKIDEKCKTSLENHIKQQKIERDSLYISNLKINSFKRSSKTWPLEDLKNDLIVVEDDLPSVDDVKDDNQILLDPNHHKTIRPKLFAFSENRRPPYWGTWRRKSAQVNGRRPFAMDKIHLDYSCDSDEEWEEEEPGESVESVAGSDDEEGEDEYDVDNDFMVPHGYLSDEEALGEDDNALSPETQKAKLKFLEHEFEDEMKKPTKIKKPRLLGIFWQNVNGDKPNMCPDTIWDFITQRKIVSSDNEITILTNSEKENEIESSNKNSIRNSRKIADDMIPDLIKLIHGNTNNRGFLIKEFQMFLARSTNPDVAANKDVSKVSIAKKIKELSTWMPCPEDGPMCTKMCWFVEKDIREKYELNDLTLPNQWSYVLVPKRRSDIPKKEKCKSPPTKTNVEIKSVEQSASKKDKFNITKFTKKMTEDDRKNQFVASPQDAKNDPPSEIKRVPILLSGPRGVDLPEKVSNDTDNASSLSTLQEKHTNVPNSESKTDNAEVKKKIPLLASGPRGKDLMKPVKTNLLTQFIKTASVKYKNSSEDDSKTETNDFIVLSD